MQFEETLREGLKRAYKVTILSAELDEKVNTKLSEAQPNVQMNGFRKGKAPLSLLKKQYGERLFSETLGESINEVIGGHFEKSDERPANQPQVEMLNHKEGEAFQAGKDIDFSFSYEALPTIPDYDFSEIALERLCVGAEAKDIEGALEQLAERSDNFKARGKTAKAKSGDQVVMDFVGRVDGEVFEGGSGEDFPLVLGSGAFIPGFEEQLEGVKTGDERDVTVTFPTDYNVAALAGKEAVFSCSVKGVNAPEKAKIDDALAKKFGAEGLDDLKEKVSENLEKEFATAAGAVLKRNLLDALDEAFSFELPPSMVESEAGQIAHQLWHDKNPDVKGHDHPEIKPSKADKKLAERRVRLALLLGEIGRKNDIRVEDSEMSQAFMERARQYPGHEREFIEFAQKNDAIRQQIQAPIFENKVVEHILAQSTVKDKKVKKATLEKAVQALDESDSGAKDAKNAKNAKKK